MSDFDIENHGSIFLLRPISDAGKAWIEEHLPDAAQRWSDAVVVEPRYIEEISTGIFRDGLTHTVDGDSRF